MSTADPNPVITKDWGVFIQSGVSFTLSLLRAAVVEWRASDTNAALDANLDGHALDPYEHEGLTRALTGPGYVHLRIAPNQTLDAVPVALTTWTE